MDEIIGAIIGAILGGTLTWYLTRWRPSRVLFDLTKLYSISLDLPETRILYRDTSLEKLYLVGLKAQNAGSQVIENPKFVIELQKGIHILGVSAEVSPGRKEANCQVSIRENEAELTLEHLYPYSLSQELVLIDLFCDSQLDELSVAQIHGNGVFQDGTGWSTQYRPTKTRYIPLLGEIYPPSGRDIIYLVLTAIGFFALLAVTVVGLALNPPVGIVSVDLGALQVWLTDPWSRLLFISLALFTSWAFAMGLRGWILHVPIPFLRHMIQIRIVPTWRPKK